MIPQYLHTQSVTTRRRCGRNNKQEAPREESADSGIGIAADPAEIKVSGEAGGGRGLKETMEGGPLSARWRQEGGWVWRMRWVGEGGGTAVQQRRGEKSQSRRPGATKCLVAQRDEPACTLAGLAVLVPFKRVISLSSRTRITSYGLAEASNTCVTHMSATTRRPGSSASRSPRSGSRRERGGSCCAAAWPREARGWAGAGEMGGPEGPVPVGMDGSVAAASVQVAPLLYPLQMGILPLPYPLRVPLTLKAWEGLSVRGSY